MHIGTENDNGSFNLAPMSSAWALGQTIVLGLGAGGQTAANLRSRPDLVISVPAPGQWEALSFALTTRECTPSDRGVSKTSTGWPLLASAQVVAAPSRE